MLLGGMAMTELQELKNWIRKNNNLLRSYSSDEIAFFALANGFSRDVVFGGICDHLTHIKRLLTFWESPLADKWMKLCHYNSGIDD